MIKPDFKNPQSVFEYIVKFLVNQGAQSSDKGGNCLYHDRHSGRRCAIGCLFPYEFDEILLNLEGNTFDGLIKKLNYLIQYDDSATSDKGAQLKKFKDWLAENLLNTNLRLLLLACQQVHDDPHNWISINMLKEKFIQVAKEFCLNSDFINEL